MRIKNIFIKHLSIIFIAVVIAFLPSLQAPFVFDDIGGIVNNIALKNIFGIGKIWDTSRTRFVTNLTFALNYNWGGLSVFDYHAVNLIIHILTTLTLYFFTKKISKNSLLAFLASLIFALHPIQTQAITYVSQRSASLATLFYLLSIYLYLKANDKKIFLTLSLLCAGLAFFTKEISYTLPLAILLTDIFFIKRDKKVKNRILLFLPYLSLLIFIIAIQFDLIFYPRETLNIISRASGQHTSTISRWEYLTSQIPITGLYFKLLLFPISQNFDYDLPQKIAIYNPNALISLIIIISLIILAFVKRNVFPLISYAIFFFFTALLVESSIFPIEDLAFEHRLYLPMAGFSLAMGFLLYNLLQHNRLAKISKVLFIPLFITLALLTFTRNNVYRSEISLWQDTAFKSPNKYRVRMALAASYNQAGLYKQAIAEYESVLTFDPKRKNLALNNLGLILLHLKDEKKAKEYFLKALEEDETDTIARNNLANLLYSQNEKEPALREYEKILEIDPENKEAIRSLGYIYITSGSIDEGIKKFEQITANPSATDISWRELGDVYRSNNRLEEAVSAYQKAIELNTRNDGAYAGLGKTYLLLGKNHEALTFFKTALDINSLNQDARIGLTRLSKLMK